MHGNNEKKIEKPRALLSSLKFEITIDTLMKNKNTTTVEKKFLVSKLISAILSI